MFRSTHRLLRAFSSGIACLFLCTSAAASPPAEDVVPAVSLEMSFSAPVLPSEEAPGPESFRERISLATDEVLANLLKFDDANIDGNYYVSEQEIRTLLGLDREPWLWDLSMGESQRNLLSHPWISIASVDWSFYPLTLDISVREEEPWLVAEIDEKTWLVSRNGKLLQPLDTLRDADLIVESASFRRLVGLSGKGSASMLARLIDQAVASVRFIDLAGGFPFEVERYEFLSEPGLRVVAMRSYEHPDLLIDIRTFSAAEEMLTQLRAVLDDLKTKDEEPKLIDLRFRNQVVVKEWETVARP